MDNALHKLRRCPFADTIKQLFVLYYDIYMKNVDSVCVNKVWGALVCCLHLCRLMSARVSPSGKLNSSECCCELDTYVPDGLNRHEGNSMSGVFDGDAIKRRLEALRVRNALNSSFLTVLSFLSQEEVLAEVALWRRQGEELTARGRVRYWRPRISLFLTIWSRIHTSLSRSF